MSHQTGIRASAELCRLFNDSRKADNLRAIKIGIKDDTFSYTRTVNSSDNFENGTVSLFVSKNHILSYAYPAAQWKLAT